MDAMTTTTEIPDALVPGRLLPNAYMVVAVKPTAGDRWIVLALVVHPDLVEYATWESTSDGITYWGHYFRDLSVAAQDFTERGVEVSPM